jgi:hypothetical protein
LQHFQIFPHTPAAAGSGRQSGKRKPQSALGTKRNSASLPKFYFTQKIVFEIHLTFLIVKEISTLCSSL